MTLPERDWDAIAQDEPWVVMCDAMLYEQHQADVPEALREAAIGAGLLVTSLALLRTADFTVDDLDPLWERDVEFRYRWREADESISCEAVFTDGAEPASVKTTARGLRGKLNAYMRGEITDLGDHRFKLGHVEL